MPTQQIPSSEEGCRSFTLGFVSFRVYFLRAVHLGSENLGKRMLLDQKILEKRRFFICFLLEKRIFAA